MRGIANLRSNQKKKQGESLLFSISPLQFTSLFLILFSFVNNQEGKRNITPMFLASGHYLRNIAKINYSDSIQNIQILPQNLLQINLKHILFAFDQSRKYHEKLSKQTTSSQNIFEKEFTQALSLYLLDKSCYLKSYSFKTSCKVQIFMRLSYQHHYQENNKQKIEFKLPFIVFYVNSPAFKQQFSYFTSTNQDSQKRFNSQRLQTNTLPPPLSHSLKVKTGICMCQALFFTNQKQSPHKKLSSISDQSQIQAGSKPQLTLNAFDQKFRLSHKFTRQVFHLNTLFTRSF
ncbi:transmembrane protein, putative (macronuclear) [Tetrahymena thermophila SB210]|uniref:Transmembrane protein, putative n=1 Tax=Tetrahymena thermophila (strain SB210) TaxID=312017 RepID=W7XIG6_TETTS|nr:transmembrane protein, putative [Tetrahymena thermophila SB210]EWS74621.1 transmembrane protein, putative [Tetrahymena thermophila SB210]|eukprot:XP_012652843.1 transmembrane protein, putative [Tetrahymena thermophila SB210]